MKATRRQKNKLHSPSWASSGHADQQALGTFLPLHSPCVHHSLPLAWDSFSPNTVSISLFNCTVCLLFPKVVGCTPVSREPLPTSCVSLSLHPRSVSAGGWSLFAGFFLSRPLYIFLFTSPDLPSSHCHSFPRPSLGTGKLISPSYRAEFLSTVCLSPSACVSGFPHVGLPLHAGADISTAGAPVWEQLRAHAVLYFFYLSTS